MLGIGPLIVIVKKAEIIATGLGGPIVQRVALSVTTLDGR